MADIKFWRALFHQRVGNFGTQWIVVDVHELDYIRTSTP